MQLSNFFFIFFLSCSFSLVSAQDALLSCNDSNTQDAPTYLAPPTVEIQDYYNALIDKYGSNDRYRAAELALQKYGCKQEEYAAKLYNVLAEEAVLMQDYEQAKVQYNQVLTTSFEAGYYTEGLLAEKEQLKAYAGLRNVAMAENDYAVALEWHNQYVDILTRDWKLLAKRNQLVNDKIYATCYQRLGKSEKALSYLMPYAFGAVSGTYGAIDKDAIDYLTTLLKTKYPKKQYKWLLNNIANEIYAESKDGVVQFYLKIFENKIYFQNDSANYAQRVAHNGQIMGQAIAHYQRKLLNSYFYQSLHK